MLSMRLKACNIVGGTSPSASVQYPLRFSLTVLYNFTNCQRFYIEGKESSITGTVLPVVRTRQRPAEL
jgi:hypothetical protein